MNPRADNTTTVNAVPQYTYAETLRELETLGVIFEYDKTPNPKKTPASLGIETTPYAIQLLAMHDHEMLHRIMTAIKLTDESARTIWRDTLGRITGKDLTKRGTNNAVTELNRLMPQYERLLAINPIDAAIMGIGKYRDSSRTFQNLLRATYIETHTGIAPGDTNYNLVQANLIHITITRPKKYGPGEVQTYLQTHHDDITYIAQRIDDTIRLLPELYERRDASADAIQTLHDITPALIEGML